jgi:hypothetical protein
MIEITPAARDSMKRLLREQPASGKALRILIDDYA